MASDYEEDNLEITFSIFQMNYTAESYYLGDIICQMFHYYLEFSRLFGFKQVLLWKTVLEIL